MDFKQKVVWITGASSGIGWHLAIAFAAAGAKVAASARRTDELEKLVGIIHEKGGEAKAFFCDVTDEQILKTCADAVFTHFGRMDIAIANAGFGVVGKVENLSAAEWDRQFRVNVTGLALTARFSIPYLRKQGGKLVLIGSVSAWFPSPGVSAYAASKAAVSAIGKALTLELKDSGIRCLTIHPGFIDSNITRVDNNGIYHAEFKDPRPAKLMWPTEKAALVMLNAIAHKSGEYVFTGHGRIAVFAAKYFPWLARIDPIQKFICRKTGSCWFREVLGILPKCSRPWFLSVSTIHQ